MSDMSVSPTVFAKDHNQDHDNDLDREIVLNDAPELIDVEDIESNDDEVVRIIEHAINTSFDQESETVSEHAPQTRKLNVLLSTPIKRRRVDADLLDTPEGCNGTIVRHADTGEMLRHYSEHAPHVLQAIQTFASMALQEKDL